MYGFDVSKLEQFITRPAEEPTPFGSVREIVAHDHYTLRQLNFNAGGVLPWRTHAQAVTLYLESGSLSVAVAGRSIPFSAGRLVEVPAGTAYQLTAVQPSVAYLFAHSPNCSGERILKEQPDSGGPACAVREPADRREKYWGEICTIVSSEIAGKRLLLKKGISGSLEFHVRKHESYYVHAGELALNLRAGRAENRLFRIPAGTTVTLPPGLMHQRGAITDTVVIEISTRDDDADSFLVEDGTKTPMPGFAELCKKKST